MHLTIHSTIVLEGCISQYTRLLYWRDASHNTLDYCTGGMHLTYTRLLYWRDASFNTLYHFNTYIIHKPKILFQSLYSSLLGEERTYLWRTSLYLAASASAEFFADIALAPMEAVKVRIQTQPGWETTLRTGVPRIMREEGLAG